MTTLKNCLCENFLAAIDMFSSIVALCSDELWKQDKKFFYLTYHISIFLDYSLTRPIREFRPGLPYHLGDPDNLPPDAVDDVIPERFYTRQEVIENIAIARRKCQYLIQHSSDEELEQRWINDDEIELHGLCSSLVVNYSLLEILFYNLRHLQHHTGQLNLLLRQKANIAADWISQSECS